MQSFELISWYFILSHRRIILPRVIKHRLVVGKNEKKNGFKAVFLFCLLVILNMYTDTRKATLSIQLGVAGASEDRVIGRQESYNEPGGATS